MAVLGPPSARVETTAGVPVNGGKLRIYNVNTTTLSSVFSDEAMSTPLTNPVVADSNGFLPVIFAAEGTYDIAYLTAANVVITGQTYNDWPTYSSGSSGAIERTLSGARVDIDGGNIGSGQTGVRIQAGSPSPDNTGGYLGLMGWDGTSADEIWIDGAEVNVRRNKSLKEGSQRINSVIGFEPITFNAFSSIDFSLINNPAGTRRWRIRLYDVYFSSAVATVNIRFSYDGGATFKSGASDYSYAFGTLIGAVTTTDDAHTEIRIQSTSSSNADNSWIIDMEVMTPNSGNGTTKVWGRIIGANNAGAGAPGLIFFEGCGEGNYGRATHIQIFPSAGTMSGIASGLNERGFGE